MMGPQDSKACQENLDIFETACQKLGVPLDVEKVEGTATSITFLGVELDTVKMEIRLPEEKLLRIRHELSGWLRRKRATKHDILSLVGLLQHATKVVQPREPFVSRMYTTAARVKELDFYMKHNKEFCSNLIWWDTFLSSWNGLSLLQWVSHLPEADFIIQMDASGTWGCGAFCHGYWLQWKWPPNWMAVPIMAKELIPILFSCVVWAPLLAKHSVLVQYDNLSLVEALAKGSYRDPEVMRLLRCLWFFVAFYDIELQVTNIAGSLNCTADRLSRNNIPSFFSLHPQVSLLPAPVPP